MNRFDETQPGGAYIVNGVLVDAHGTPIVQAEPERQEEPKPKAVSKSKGK